MSSTEMTIDQLCLSPFNVRTNEADATATSALERSIRARGLLLPLLVHPMRGNRKKWGVFAGGRRYRSIKALIERGELSADYPVHVIVRDAPEGELVEMSTVENFRRDLRLYEIYAAVVSAHRKGERVEQIAEALGQEVVWVKRCLRLGTVAKPIFDAYAAETITLEEAQAYASTEDEVLQLLTFERVKALPTYERNAHTIRRLLKVGDAEAARMLRFVGEDAYRDAGGRFELDLFAEAAETRGRVEDEGILQQLVDAELDQERARVRARVARDIRFVTAPPTNSYGGSDWTLEVRPKGEGDNLVLPKGDVVGFLKIGEDGKPEVSFWWESPRAKHGTGKPGRSATPVPFNIGSGAALGQNYENARSFADREIKDEAGVSADTVQILRSIRRAIVRAALVQDARQGGDVAVDYLVWAQLRVLIGRNRASQVGMASLVPEHDPAVVEADVAATHASAEWKAAVAELDAMSFCRDEDLGEAFRDYRASPPSLKRHAQAVVVGVALERSLNALGYQLPIHDVVADELHLNRPQAIRHWWRPTAALLDRIPRAQRAAIAEPFVDAPELAALNRAKSAELTPQILRIVTGAATMLKKTAAIAAAHWVHPLLAFAPSKRSALLNEVEADAATIAATAELEEVGND